MAYWPGSHTALLQWVAEMAPQWAALLLFAAAFNLWAVLSYRKIR